MKETDNRKLEWAFDQHRDDLKRLANARLDRRLNGRVDASDIIQDTYLTAIRRFAEYEAQPEVSLPEWLRFLTVQAVTAAHRFHLGRQKRTVMREVVATSEDLSVVRVVDMLAGSLTSPHSAAIRSELQDAAKELLESMDETDQEIIRLRHAEMLSNDECAKQIGISRSAASKRYIRAIRRLRAVAKELLP